MCICGHEKQDHNFNRELEAFMDCMKCECEGLDEIDDLEEELDFE